MDLNSYPVPHIQVAARIVDDAAVIVLADTGEVNVLNAVGTRIWELVDGMRSVQEIADGIAAEFEVTSQESLKDVAAFLRELEHSGALIFQEHPIGASLTTWAMSD